MRIGITVAQALGIVFLIGVSSAGGSIAQAAAPARIEMFSPQGRIKAVRQVSARFSAPMVALGDPRAPDPFTMNCAAKGVGRWADERNWVYDFDADLPGGVRCTFSLKKGLKTLAGAPVGGRHTFTFNTGGPSVRASMPYEGSSTVDENQIFLLGLDAPATPPSVKAHAHCAIEGLGEQVPVTVLEGEAREAVLRTVRKKPYLYHRLTGADGAAARSRENQIIALQCQRTLPAAHQVSLIWGKGIAAPSGLQTRKTRVLRFRTRPAFAARFSCQRSNAKAPCLPMMDMQLAFNAPIAAAMARQIALVAPDGTRQSPDLGEDGAAPTISSVTFKAPFAPAARYTLTLPAGLRDDAGRRLQNAAAFPLAVHTDSFPPLVKFASHFGIIEAHAGALLPVTVRNVEPSVAARLSAVPDNGATASVHRERDVFAMLEWMKKAREAGRWRGQWVKDKTGREVYRNDTGTKSIFDAETQVRQLDLPVAQGGKAFEVIGIPLQKPGFYAVEVKSKALGAALLGRPAPRYVATTALVTNMAVHFQWGREGSLIWVTALDSGKPVPGVKLALGDTCTRTMLWKGVSGKDGTAHLLTPGHPPQSWGSCYSDADHPLVVTAAKGDDFSFALSSWNDGIAPYDFGIPMGGEWEADFAHSVFDRTLLRAGETVSMKLYVRRHTGTGLELPPRFKTNTKARISHNASGQEFFIPLDFDADGTALAQFAIPKDARLGVYSVDVKIGADWKEAGRFRVEAFRLPTMNAIVQGPPGPLIAPKSVPVDVMVRYLSGGGASGLAVKLRTLVRPVPARFAGYDEYRFDSEDLAPQSESTGQGGDESEMLKTGLVPARLDGEGAARLTIEDLPVLPRHSQLTAELEYRDANGQVLTKAARFDLWPAALAVGIKTDGWAATADKVKLHAVALHVDGTPAPGAKVAVTAYQRQRYSWRKRLIGGFYSYETSTRITPLRRGCSGKAGKNGVFVCSFAPGMSGELILQARTTDAAGRTATATTSVWVAGKDDWWFSAKDGNRMDLLVEKAEYQGGDTARVQVRSPFRKATALVTIEREGVLDSFVTPISGKHPVIPVPIKGSYAPNVFVSVLAVRGRTPDWQNWLADKARQYDLPFVSRDGGKATALIDLAKPAWRLGLAKVRVGWRAHRLAVMVTPRQKTWRIREQAEATIAVRRADGKALAPGAEVAVAVVDEALLQLAPNRSWDLLKAMMHERGLEVLTATAQMQVVGKRHYGRKAVAHGGGGGRGNARELFDTLLLWQGRVTLDKNGEAVVRFPLNDSLSRFRIAAIASDGLNLFGTGSASIATTQDVQVLPGLPQIVRTGDRFDAPFTVRNASDHAMNVLVQGRASGIGALPAREIALPPGQARTVHWSVQAPDHGSTIAWHVSAREQGGKAGDAVAIVQQLKPAVPVRTVQASLRQLSAPVHLTLARPADALEGRGGISVRLQARLGESLQGVQEYMQAYPYNCLEQRTSAAIALQDKARWDRLMRALPAYMDSDGLVKYWPSDWLRGSDTLTAYMLSISNQAGWEIPQSQRAQMLDALQGFAEGRISRDSPLRTADLTIRKLAALAALARYGRARAQMLTALDLDPVSLPTSAVLDWLDVLKRVDGIRGRAAKIAKARQILRSRLNFQGTRMGFSTEARDGLWWLMVSGDSNAARALISLADAPQWRADMGRMARGLLGRQDHGHWRTTTANAWGTLAMRTFSSRFERERVSGESTLEANGKRQSLRWGNKTALQFAPLPWSGQQEDLRLAHVGKGAPWAFITARAAIPLKAPLSTGYAIKRTITPVSQAKPGQWQSGDVMRVHIEVTAQSDMSWVAINDPVPAGAQILGSGLGGDSALLRRGERRDGKAWPVFEERRPDAYHAYYRFVPKGTFSFDYTLRLNSSGDFNLPPTRVEAMYVPEMFGEVPLAPLHVASAQP